MIDYLQGEGLGARARQLICCQDGGDMIMWRGRKLQQSHHMRTSTPAKALRAYRWHTCAGQSLS